MKAHEIDLDAEYPFGTAHSRHRRPSEAGSADRYYGRPWQPNFAYKGYTFHDGEMTKEQIAEYTEAWENEDDRKDWG